MTGESVGYSCLSWHRRRALQGPRGISIGRQLRRGRGVLMDEGSCAAPSGELGGSRQIPADMTFGDFFADEFFFFCTPPLAVLLLCCAPLARTSFGNSTDVDSTDTFLLKKKKCYYLTGDRKDSTSEENNAKMNIHCHCVHNQTVIPTLPLIFCS